MTLALSRLERAERADVHHLMLETTGRTMSDAEFEWFFDHNPVGEGIVWGAREGGTLAGVLGTVFARALTPAGTERVAFPVHAATRAGSRQRGIFSQLELCSERIASDAGAVVGIAFPNVTRSTFVGRLGWSDLGAMRIWARPLRLRGLLRRRRSGGLRAARGDELDRFGEAHEQAWREVQPQWRNCVARDAAYLNWRYLESPRGYRAFAEGGSYAVVRHLVHRGVSAAVVCDLVGPPPVQRRLLRRCLLEARGAADAAIAVPAPGQRAAYVSLGFAPTPVRIRVVGKALRPDAILPRAWFFSLGDTDFV